MSTYGLVTVMSKKDGVLMKIMTTINGYLGKALGDRIRKSWPVTIEETERLAEEVGFGERGRLVIVSKVTEGKKKWLVVKEGDNVSRFPDNPNRKIMPRRDIHNDLGGDGSFGEKIAAFFHCPAVNTYAEYEDPEEVEIVIV